MLSPVAPHIAEELWDRLGHEGTIVYVEFPTFEEKWLVDDELELPVQINGKVRARITVPADAGQEDVKAAALGEQAVASRIEGKDVKKVIVVPGKLVNVVAK